MRVERGRWKDGDAFLREMFFLGKVDKKRIKDKQYILNTKG